MKIVDQIFYNIKTSKEWVMSERQTRILLLIGLGNTLWSVVFLPVLDIPLCQEIFFGSTLTVLGVMQLLFLCGSNVKLRLLLTFLSTILNGTVLTIILSKGYYSPAIPSQAVLALASAYIFVTTRELKTEETEDDGNIKHIARPS
jgi:hypothetical protein